MWKSKTFLYLFFILLGVGISLLLNIILNIFYKGGYNIQNNIPIWQFAVIALIFAPLFETFLYQFLIFKVSFSFVKIKKNKFSLSIICIISSFLFGISHYYNIGYMVFGFITGLYFAYVYMYCNYLSKLNLHGFIAVVLTHFFINLLGFLQNNWLEIRGIILK